MKVHATFFPFGSFPKLFPRYFFAYCVFTCCLVAGQTTKYALQGQEVTLTTDIQTQPEEILWKHNGNKVVEFNGQTQQQFGSYQGRADLDWHSADLSIINLGFEDSGDYELQIFANNKLLKSFHYLLEVIEIVAKPTISCALNNGSSSGKSGPQATLTCSTESKQSQSLLEFDWFSDGKKQIGPKLIIPLGEADDNLMYNCIVSNKLSQENATFTAKECYPDKSLNIPVIIGVCVGVTVLIMFIGLCILLCRKGCFACEETYDLEKQTNPETTDENDGEEKRVLLGRAPTIPSQQTLGHLFQKRNDSIPLQKDPFVKELRQSIKHRSSSEDDNITSSSLPVPKKPPRLQDHRANDEGDEDELGKTVENKDTECDTKDSSNSDKKKETENSVGDVALLPVAKPRYRLSFQNTNSSPEGKQKLEVISDQAARESDCSSPGKSGEELPTTSPHKQQPPSTNANSGEEILQEGDKQAPEDKTPDGLSDRKETDHRFNTPEETQSLTKSKPDSSNSHMILKSPDTEHTVPDDKDKDEIRPNSENRPEKGGSEDNVTKKISHPPLVPKKSDNAKKFVKKNKEKADENKPSEAVEEKPSESSPESEEADAVFDKHHSDKKEEAANPEGDVTLLPVAKPRSGLSFRNTNSSPEGKQKLEVISDQAARESDCSSPGESGEELLTTSPHEQQPPSTETNSGEEIPQGGDKQVPENKTPDVLSDQEEKDLGFNNPEETQSLTKSKPDNSNSDTVS